MSVFKRVPLYIQIGFNSIEITDLLTGNSISKNAIEKFSTNRVVLADFNTIDRLIRITLEEIVKKRLLFPAPLSILIQQTEELEDGITETEKRALRDLGELAGGTKVVLAHHTRKLSWEEALHELKSGN